MTRFSNINTLLAFVTVAQEGSVSRAAEVLNLTQPAISHQIKRLSEETGMKLFQRTATGLHITPDGSAILLRAETVIKAMQDFRRAARKQSGRISGTLKIGTIVDPEFIRLGLMLSHLRAEHPDLATELVHGVSGDTLSRLKSGRIDAGFFLSAPEQVDAPDADDLNHYVRLAKFSYRVIAPSGWQKRVENADWATLATLPWIGTPEKSVHHRLLAKVFAKQGGKQNVVALVDQEASMLEMVRSGVGLSLSRESIALHEQQSSGLAICNAVSIPACLSVVTLKHRKESPTISALFGLLQNTWR